MKGDHAQTFTVAGHRLGAGHGTQRVMGERQAWMVACKSLTAVAIDEQRPRQRGPGGRLRGRAESEEGSEQANKPKLSC